MRSVGPVQPKDGPAVALYGLGTLSAPEICFAIAVQSEVVGTTQNVLLGRDADNQWGALTLNGGTFASRRDAYAGHSGFADTSRNIKTQFIVHRLASVCRSAYAGLIGDGKNA